MHAHGDFRREIRLAADTRKARIDNPRSGTEAT